MPDAADLPVARAAAATLLRERGYDREAAMVAAGEGDDFIEVRTALALIPILARGGSAAPATGPTGRSAPPRVRSGRRLVGEEC